MSDIFLVEYASNLKCMCTSAASLIVDCSKFMGDIYTNIAVSCADGLICICGT